MTIELPSDIESALTEQAQRQGTTPELLAVDYLRERLAPAAPDASASGQCGTLADFLADHIGVLDSGEIVPEGARMSEDAGKKFAADLYKKQQGVEMVLNIAVAEPPPLRIVEGGAVRVGTTRVSLDTVVGAFQNGCTPEEIVIKYPTLDLVDVYAVIAYYLRHRDEVEAYLKQRRQEAVEIRRKIEARFPPDGIRERLLARREPA